MSERAIHPRVLLTGMSGTGKSSVIAALRQKGFRAIDMDDSGYSFRDASGNQLWCENLLAEALAHAGNRPLFISGCAENQVRFYPHLTHIVLLSAPWKVMLARLSRRSGNPYGKTAAEREEIRRNLEQVEPLLRCRASCEIDTSIPLKQVVAKVLLHVDLA